jgi:hypothetical protein
MAENGTVPAEEFLDGCPTNVEQNFLAVLEVVREAPPPKFSGGGKWEAMHKSMGGYYELRGTGPNRMHYRLFCLLDNGTLAQLAARGLDRPVIAVINGMAKRNATTFSDREYRRNVRDVGDRYLATIPRPIAK